MKKVEELKKKYVEEWNRKFKEKWKKRRLEKLFKWNKQVIGEVENIELISFSVVKYKTNFHSLKGVKIIFRLEDTEEQELESLEYQNFDGTELSYWYSGASWNHRGDDVSGDPVYDFFSVEEEKVYDFEDEFRELIKPEEMYEMFLTYQEEVCGMLNEIPHTFVVENGDMYIKVGEEKFDIHIK